MVANINSILPYAVIILPPGSASSALQAAVNSATSGDVIEISSDMTFTSAVSIPAGKTITIQSGTGDRWVLTQTASNVRHFTVSGTLVLQDISLNGGSTGGGVIVNSGGSLIMNGGADIRSCAAVNGGGVQVSNGGSFQMNGGEMSGNRSSGTSSTNGGGAVYGGATGTIAILGGIISGNTAGYNGGGVFGYLVEFGVGVVISGNTANNSGGGVYANAGSNITFDRCTINGNAANSTSTTAGGGGIYLNSSAASPSALTVIDTLFSGNAAASNGGGILGYTGSTITISGSAVIGGDQLGDGNQAGSYGGGVYGYYNSTITVADSVKISHNRANNGGGIGCTGNSTNASRVTVGGMAEIRNNEATSRGGGIGAFSGSGSALHEVALNGEATITGNTAGYGGGGIFAHTGSIVQINSGRVNENQSVIGGGIYASNNSVVAISGGVMALNEAGLNGGGIFVVAGRIDISGGTIFSNRTTGIGGGICCYQDFRGASSSVGITYSSQITITGGSVTGNEAANGGGIGCFNAFDSAGNDNVAECFIAIEGGEVSGNTATGNGGGIYSYAYSESGTKYAIAEITVAGGSVTGNAAQANGGGIYSYNYGGSGGATVRASCAITVADGGAVSNHTAATNGGGICGIALTASRCDIVVSDGAIGNNTAAQRGGGIYVTAPATVEVVGASSIINNRARNGDGGGIYTEAATYSNLATGGGTVFSGNSASRAFLPPPNAAALYPNLQFASTSIANHPLNNYDINFTSGQPLPFYHVVYNANGGVGGFIGPDIVPGGTDTVLSPEEAEISREGFAFTGWNTQPDGSGTAYAPGNVINLTDNLTLYAQWTPNLFAVAYDANGGTGGFVDADIPYGTVYTILSSEQAGVSRMGYAFTGWNTDPDGGGTPYAPGNVIAITGDLALYAQWAIHLYAVVYEPNGGVGGFVDADIPHGTIYRVLSEEEAGVSRADYTFTGWNTQPDGGGAVYEPGDMITVTDGVTLYAQWEAPDLFSVVYDANGGVGGRVDVNISYGAEYVVLSPEEAGVSRAGFAFAGWNSQPDGGGTPYQPGAVIVITGDVTLYAQWTVHLYRVIYSANGGTGGFVDADIPHGAEYIILSPEQVGISRADYAFTGWNTEPNGMGAPYQIGDVITITGDTVLYAQWESIVKPICPPPCHMPCCLCCPCCIPCCRACCKRYYRPCINQIGNCRMTASPSYSRIYDRKQTFSRSRWATW